MRRRLAIAYVILIAACGSRTALVGDENDESSDDGGIVTHKDGSTDSARDVDVKLDGAPDVFRNDCPDAASTFIYLISEAQELYSYDPGGGGFRDIGLVTCPTFFDHAFSMAVDRQGAAYVLLYDQPQNQGALGNLYRVSTATAKCESIPAYVPGQQNFQVYGMGFATNGGGPSESLYVQGAADSFDSMTGLATIDTNTFQLSFIGNNSPALQGGELTGTGDGRLFGFFFFASDTSTFYLGELDKTNGQLLSQTQLTGVPTGGGFSFAYWGGDFYFFTVPDQQNTIATRYRPSDQTYVNVATLPGATIVGAGVSTCAPQ